MHFCRTKYTNFTLNVNFCQSLSNVNRCDYTFTIYKTANTYLGMPLNYLGREIDIAKIRKKIRRLGNTNILNRRGLFITSYILYQHYFVFVVDTIESLIKEEFDALYGDELDFTTACSDGNIVSVKDNGSHLSVDYETRLEYCQLVKKIRMFEFIDQV